MKTFRAVLLCEEKRSDDNYQKLVIEQYKIYVEMADRISSRRALANTFFVGLHTVLVSTFAVLLKEGILGRSVIGYMPFLAVVLLCYVWWRIIASYRQLNSSKFKVIHEIELLLVIAPYSAEWVVLGEGLDPKRYVPISHVENWVPAVFALMYALAGFSLMWQ